MLVVTRYLQARCSLLFCLLLINSQVLLAGGGGDPNGVILPVGDQMNKIDIPSWVTNRNSQCMVSSDFFYNKSFNNNDGNYNWAGPWYEHNDNNNPSSGKYQIDEGELVMYGRCCLGWNAGDVNLMKYWSRGLNTEGADFMQLVMSHKRWKMGISHFTVDVYSKGVWHDGIRDYKFAAGSFKEEKITIPSSYASSDMRIRVRNSEFSSDGDIYYWDYVAVAQCHRPVSAYRIAHSGSAVTCEEAPITITSLDDGGGNYTDTGGHKIRITARSTDGQPTTGQWSIISGKGSINNTESGASNNDGVAYYSYANNDAVVQLGLSHPNAGSVNIDIVSISPGGGIKEISSGDSNLVFSDIGLKISNIGTQLSGKRSDLNPSGSQVQVRVVESSGSGLGACQSKVNDGDVLNVALSVRCVNPATCAQNTNLLEVRSDTGTTTSHHASGQPTAVTSLRFEKVGSDVYANMDLNYQHAGLIGLDLMAQIPASGSDPALDVSGSSNDFLVKPWQIAFSNIVSTAGTTNPAKGPGDSAASDQFLKAGEGFNAQLRAVQWQQADDLNNDGVVDSGANLSDNSTSLNFNQSLDLSVVNNQPSHSAGNLTQASVTMSNGQAAITGLEYSEVGSMQIQASTSSYQGENVSGSSETIGRFDVGYLELSGTASLSTGNSCNFSYLGQTNLSLDIKGLVARNSHGNMVHNYDSSSGFATEGITLHIENANSGADLSTRVAGLQAGHWQNGVFKSTHSIIGADYYSFFNVSRLGDDSVDGPYKDLAISFSMPSLQGLDTLASSALDCDNSDALKPNCQSKLISSDFDLYYGVLSAPAVLGNKLDSLPLSLRIHYIDGSDPSRLLQRMDIDSCNRVDQNSDSVLTGMPSLSGGDAGRTTVTSQPADNTKFINGEIPNTSTYVLAPPSDNNEADVTVNYPTPDWLKYDWDNNSATPVTSPSGEANFKTFRGHDRIIYWDEN